MNQSCPVVFVEVKMKKYLLVIAFCCTIIMSYQRAYGCDCLPVALTAWGELQARGAVFSGEVINIRKIQVPSSSIIVRTYTGFVAEIATETAGLVSLMCGKKENQAAIPSP